MKELFLIVFFGKVILLTPNPIDIDRSIELFLDKPITAITSGASILIDISSMVSDKERESARNSDKELIAMFPPESIVAKLIGNDDYEVMLKFNGGFQVGNDTIELILHAESGIPAGIEFNKVHIQSTIELSSVKVFWKNYKH